jgi:tetratricopeptide (TPR) repeat protein
LDPEVAATAERLLAQMTVRWTRPADSPQVRDLLELYGRLDEEERAEAIAGLAVLEDREGLAALCRVARFDLSEKVASLAAAAVIGGVDLAQRDSSSGPPLEVSEQGRRELAEALAEQNQLYGPSNRATWRWLGQLAAPGDDPAQAADRWAEEVERLRDLVKRNESAVDPAVMEALAWNLLRLQLLAGQQDQAAAATRMLAEANPRRAAALLQQALRWMAAAEADAAIDRVLEDPNPIDYLTTQRGMYLAAETRLKQGRGDAAEALALRAFETKPGPEDVLGSRGRVVLRGRSAVGYRLREKAHADWARRELRGAIAEEGYLSPDGAFATWELADSLQDGAQYAQAAEELGKFLAEASASEDNTRAYKLLVESGAAFFQPLEALRANEAYFRALASRDAGDPPAERAALAEALTYDDSNADIVIALYRATRPGEPQHEDALNRIKTLADEFEEQIDQEPDDPIAYNQWAWLIANTEGDYAKAVRYSQRSLDMKPEHGGYLDTLGRCYYAAGDLEKAIDAQHRAIAQQPQFQVMRRQLAFFETELAKRE